MVARKYGVVYTPDRLADFAAELLCSEIEESKFDNIAKTFLRESVM